MVNLINSEIKTNFKLMYNILREIMKIKLMYNLFLREIKIQYSFINCHINSHIIQYMTVKTVIKFRIFLSDNYYSNNKTQPSNY